MVLEQIIGQIIIWALPVLVAVVFHEVAHGWVASRLGDPTAAKLGRLTLNPFAHVDIFGTILVPLMLIAASSPFVFGWAKPVPVNYHNLRNPKRDMMWVAAAGPAMNLVLAAGFTVVWKLLAPLTGSQTAPLSDPGAVDFFALVVLMAQSGILINVTLAVFNLLPLPPLDGGRVLVGLLPQPLSMSVARIEPFGFLILIVLLMTRTLDQIIRPPTEFLLKLYLGVF
ncbi:MAG TPA: site-2 protease family protein [Candidatus Binatia bacterium]